MRAARLFVFFSFCACQSTANPPPLPDSDAASPRNPGGGPTCAFAAQQPFALPVANGVSRAPLQLTADSVPCSVGSGTYDFELRDMDGDLHEDLVVTRSCDDASIGTTAWLVYPNTGSGFGSAIRFALPALPTSPQGCVRASLVDVDGDQRPDLVVTSLCTDTTVGSSQWLVYPSSGTGFASTAEVFHLPAASASNTFASTEVDAPSCTSFQPAFGFFDLDGDRKADLVITSACDDPSVGISHWRVYPGTGTDLSPPVSFTLPGAIGLPSPRQGEIACQASVSSPRYAVLDFDGDLKPDVVVTKSCADAGAGSSHWLVYPNDGASFGQAQIVPLPALPGQPSGAFDAVVESAQCTSGAALLAHALVDVDGDLKPDLVITRDCTDASLGVADWFVFRNQGAAFGAASTYSLPAVLGATATAPADLSGALSCGTNGSHAAFVAAPLLGPELDLVVTGTCGQTGVGVSSWLLFRPTCSP